MGASRKEGFFWRKNFSKPIGKILSATGKFFAHI